MSTCCILSYILSDIFDIADLFFICIHYLSLHYNCENAALWKLAQFIKVRITGNYISYCWINFITSSTLWHTMYVLHSLHNDTIAYTKTVQWLLQKSALEKGYDSCSQLMLLGRTIRIPEEYLYHRKYNHSAYTYP